ncbi:carbohydrate porin [Rhodoferax sp.]|uniref:carbohydrate porin n=1 Tax=Rhodoferax sp. TaxID=50421 RepID=UPI0008B734F4|nr:carbohydrate porin [Rhodoferax sp.]OGO95345.1 MAG: hypothetical protein A2037_07515 [Curvibacter sp. GWA2_63_95]
MKKAIQHTSHAALGVVLAALAGSALAGAEFGANLELDNTARNGGAVAEGDKGLSQTGRIEVGVSAKAGDDMFVAAKTTLLTQKGGGVVTDDMWVQMGNKGGNVKLGRFEAADLFPLNADTLVNHAGTVYGTNSLRGRMGSDAFHGTGTINLTDTASLEVGYIDGTKNAVNTTNAKGLRAVLALGAGPWSGRVGFESGEYAPVGTADANKIKGWGFTTTYDAGSFKLTGNYSLGQQNAAANNRQTALGLSASVGALGLGFVNAVNDKAGGEVTVQTAYVAYAMSLFGVKGATWTPALSRSTAKDSTTGVTNDENALRVRVRYDF